MVAEEPTPHSEPGPARVALTGHPELVRVAARYNWRLIESYHRPGSERGVAPALARAIEDSSPLIARGGGAKKRIAQLLGLEQSDASSLRKLRWRALLGSMSAELEFTDRRGVLIAGPPAAGKTTFLKAVRGAFGAIAAAASEADSESAKLLRHRVAFRDTRGHLWTGLVAKERPGLLVSTIKPRVLVLVFAAGDYGRPQVARSAVDERAWLNEFIEDLSREGPPPRLDHVVLMVTKLDRLDFAASLRRYQRGRLRELLDRLRVELQSLEPLLIPAIMALGGSPRARSVSGEDDERSRPCAPELQEQIGPGAPRLSVQGVCALLAALREKA